MDRIRFVPGLVVMACIGQTAFAAASGVPLEPRERQVAAQSATHPQNSISAMASMMTALAAHDAPLVDLEKLSLQQRDLLVSAFTAIYLVRTMQISRESFANHFVLDQITADAIIANVVLSPDAVEAIHQREAKAIVDGIWPSIKKTLELRADGDELTGQEPSADQRAPDFFLKAEDWRTIKLPSGGVITIGPKAQITATIDGVPQTFRAHSRKRITGAALTWDRDFLVTVGDGGIVEVRRIIDGIPEKRYFDRIRLPGKTDQPTVAPVAGGPTVRIRPHKNELNLAWDIHSDGIRQRSNPKAHLRMLSSYLHPAVIGFCAGGLTQDLLRHPLYLLPLTAALIINARKMSIDFRHEYAAHSIGKLAAVLAFLGSALLGMLASLYFL